jgi:hypothetical protein
MKAAMLTIRVYGKFRRVQPEKSLFFGFSRNKLRTFPGRDWRGYSPTVIWISISILADD